MYMNFCVCYLLDCYYDQAHLFSAKHVQSPS